MFFVIVIVISHSSASAQGLDLPSVASLPDRPLPDLLVGIINGFLGLLGVIALGVLIYGGYVWMTSGGISQRIALAKRILLSAVIGLIIILLSWAIIQFIFNAVNGNNNNNNNVINPPILPPGSSVNFRVDEYSPKGNVPVVVCMPIQARFNRLLDQSTVVAAPNLSPTIHLRLNCTTGFPDGDAFCAAANLGNCGTTINVNKYCDTEVPGNMTFPGPSALNFTFRPSKDLEKNAAYLVIINDGLSGVRSQSGDECIGAASDLGECKQWEFTTNDQTDKVPPQVAKVSPVDAATNVCRAKTIAAQFNEDMDETTLRTNGAFSITPADTIFSPSVPSYTVLRENPSSPMTANTFYAPLLNSDIITDACGNFLDGNEDGISQKSPADDYAPPPINTVKDWSFTTDETTQCVPKIDSIVPVDSYYDSPNDTLTITGENFDDIADTVLFADNLPIGSGTPACFNGTHTQTDQACLLTWDGVSPLNSITVKVPAGKGSSNGAISGPIKVQVGQFQCGGQTTCKDGANKGLACNEPTEIADCPLSSCGDDGSCEGGANSGLGCDANMECPGAESAGVTIKVLSPYIKKLAPSTLGAGSSVGIFGKQFGNAIGTVDLIDGVNRIPLVLPCGDNVRISPGIIAAG